MAATPYAAPYNASSSAFNIFRDNGAVRTTPQPQCPTLPGGACNFVDLAHGPSGIKCGCRRFWSRQPNGLGNYIPEQVDWCMCSHHACFHDDVQKSTEDGFRSTTALESAPMAQCNELGQENEKPRSNRIPLSPVQDFSQVYMHNSLDIAAVDLPSFNYDEFTTNVGPEIEIQQVRPQTAITDTESMPDTLSWRNIASTHGQQTPQPPIPSQYVPSQSQSTTASSHMRYLQPFGGVGLNTLSGVPKTQPQVMANNRGEKSSNEGHTSDDAISVASGATTAKPGRSRSMAPPPPPMSVISTVGNSEALCNLTDVVNIHETRIDRLETGSIYADAHEECSEKHDLTDIRVVALEQRMDEVEKQIDNGSVASSRGTTQPDDDPILHAAMAHQLETLQTRVNRIETTSHPSHSSPWELEVVFLPFPLKGIWQRAQEFKAGRLPGGRLHWTQLPSSNTNSRATPDPQILATYDEWAGEDSDWLLPRACVPGKVVDQRLRSRGFIKTVSLRGGDARSVQIAVGNAFQNILRSVANLTNPRSPYAPDARVDRFFGLQQPWVPLRKVHKDSRLRLLAPAELLTPVLWDATFLMDSVVMKATGVHRLYITQPEAYLQDSHLSNYRGAEHSWTWQRLREFARVYPDSQDSIGGSEVPEADADEAQWTYNDRLDEVAQARQPSLGSLQEGAVAGSRASDGSNEQFFTGPSNPAVSMMSPGFMRAQSPLIPKDRIGSHSAPSFRAGSVPPLSSPIMSSPRNGRRVSSFAVMPALAGPSYQRHSSPLVTSRASPRHSVGPHPTPLSIITKYHHKRSTRSPSVRGMHNNPRNTPRWSNRSYSRSPSVGPFFQNVYVEDPVRGERRVTPFAYPTPHSNAPPEALPPRLRSRSVSRSGDCFEDEDENMIEGFDNHGSSTESSEEDDPDIDVYQDENDILDDLESETDHQASGHPQALPPSSQPQGSDDYVLPGIEDSSMSDEEEVDEGGDAQVDGDQEETDDDEDNMSDNSSAPSEYPSRQPQPLGDGREMTHGPEAEDMQGVGFSFHGAEQREDQEDEEEDEDEDGNDDDDDDD